MNDSAFKGRVFLSLVLLVTVGFGWVLMPYYVPIFWAVVLAIIFYPLQQYFLNKLKGRNSWAALATLTVCLLIAVLPVLVIIKVIIQEGMTFYTQVQSGSIDIAKHVQLIHDALPASLQAQWDRLGFTDAQKIREFIAQRALQVSQYLANTAVSFGQGTFEFVIGFGIMVYLLFFLLRDGVTMTEQIRQAIPMSRRHKDLLLEKFTIVVRATVKGNIAIAAVQGFLGGLIFAILSVPSAVFWGVVMAVFSLLPAIGASLVWAPVAVYLLVSGSIVEGVILIAYGVLVMGLVDNFMRPLLVGKDLQMADYLVLISTLGGIAVFGLNGFVMGPMMAALFIVVWSLMSEDETAQKAQEKPEKRVDS